MSAFVVSKTEIAYLVEAGAVWRVYAEVPGELQRGPLPDERRAREALGQMLSDENVRSVNARYREDDEAETYDEQPRMLWHSFDPVQVIKCAHCYEYQSCEHEGWAHSKAKGYIDSLIKCAIGKLPGYNAAKWGAPEPTPGLTSLSDLLSGNRM